MPVQESSFAVAALYLQVRQWDSCHIVGLLELLAPLITTCAGLRGEAPEQW